MRWQQVKFQAGPPVQRLMVGSVPFAEVSYAIVQKGDKPQYRARIVWGMAAYEGLADTEEKAKVWVECRFRKLVAWLNRDLET